MRKLMEGRGPRAPGVAAKVGALVETIGAGGWCEEQGSLMRALAYGILDPDGERHRLAQLHRHACPACRAYVRSLRGLAAVLPPRPCAVAVGARRGSSGRPARAGRCAAPQPLPTSAGCRATGAGAAGGRAVSVGRRRRRRCRGGGLWLAGGPLGAKLAVGCLLVLGVGAGCAALEGSFGTDRFGLASSLPRTP